MIYNDKVPKFHKLLSPLKRPTQTPIQNAYSNYNSRNLMDPKTCNSNDLFEEKKQSAAELILNIPFSPEKLP